MGKAIWVFQAWAFRTTPPTLLAQANGPGGNSMFPPSTLVMFGVIGVLFYYMLIRPQRREEAARQAMLSNLKKNDRVVTHSGIYGIVTSVRTDADEVTLKVDENSNTKIRMTLSSISKVLSETASEN